MELEGQDGMIFHKCFFFKSPNSEEHNLDVPKTFLLFTYVYVWSLASLLEQNLKCNEKKNDMEKK